MDFRQNASRRRRVMRDELTEVVPPVTTAATGSAPLRRYCTEEVLAVQPTLLQFLPKKPWLVAGVLTLTFLAAGVVLVSPLVRGQASVVEWRLTAEVSDLLDPSRSGSLAQVGLQTIALMNWLLAYQIFHLRRHREDDYHGVYQIWWWCLWPLGLASMLSSGAISELLVGLVSALYPVEWVATTTWALLSVGLLSGGILVPRLFCELRESWSARAFLIGLTLSAAGFATVRTTTQFEGWQVPGVFLTTPLDWWVLLNVFTFACLLTTLSYVSADVFGQRSAEADEAESGMGEPLVATIEQGRGDAAEGNGKVRSVPVARGTVNHGSESGAEQARSTGQVAVPEQSDGVEDVEANLLQRRKRRRAA